MSIRSKIREVRRVKVLVRHRHSRKRAKEILENDFKHRSEWHALVQEHAWDKEGFTVLFILARDGHTCRGSIRIEVGHVLYQLDDLPLLFLASKPLIEATVETHLERVLKGR